MLPFPNDFFTERDAGTPTGRRLALRRAAMPASEDGVRIDPREWNRADGFSPGQQITVRIPGLDTHAAFDRSGIVPITPGRSAEVQPFYAIPRLTAFPYGGSALVVFDSGPFTPANPRGTPVAPAANLPPTEGQDPHEFPRLTAEAREMKDQFLRIGGRLQTPPCGGGVCHSNGYAGP
jgi:hypothetical protein